jgi:hypothetical protein
MKPTAGLKVVTSENGSVHHVVTKTGSEVARLSGYGSASMLAACPTVEERKRYADLFAQAPTMAVFLEKVAYEPVGRPEASDAEILQALTDEARSILRAVRGEEV